LHRGLDHFLSLDHLRDLLLERSRSLPDNNFFHELFSFDIFDFPGLFHLVNLLNSSIITITSFAPKLLLYMRPSLLRHPLTFKLRVADDICKLPVVF
jgi:hypothetical protein